MIAGRQDSVLVPVFVMFATTDTSRETRYSCHCETLRVNRQWHWNHATKFVRWQHRAMRHEVRFAVLVLVLHVTKINVVWCLGS